MNSKEKTSKKYNTILCEYTGDIMHVAQLSEFISNRLYLMVFNDERGPSPVPKFRDWKNALNDKNIFYLNADALLEYNNFNHDFGPYNLGSIFRYINILRKKLKIYKRVVHCAHQKSRNQMSNAAFLICAYLIIEENWTAEQAYSVCSQQNKYHYRPFRDSTKTNTNVETISVKECLNALYKAKWFGFFDLSDFDLNEFEHYSNPLTGGDISWILPDSLLAFPSPCSGDYVHRCNGRSACSHIRHPPEFYYQYFKDNDVKQIVRLNSKVKYNANNTFVAVADIKHSDMSFPDGYPPSESILESFLKLCERYIDNDTKPEFGEELVEECEEELEEEEEETSDLFKNYGTIKGILPLTNGAVAVHCRAGLGRTGCLIASYIMKHWPFAANEAIGWVRICRPGSIFGAQQRWLIENEKKLKLAGQLWRQKMKIPMDRYKCYQNGIYSVRRHRSVAINAYEYVDEPPEEFDTDEDKPSCSSSFNKLKCVQSEKCDQIEIPSTSQLTLANTNCAPDQKDDHVLDLSLKKPLENCEDKNQLLLEPLLSNEICHDLIPADSAEVVHVFGEATVSPTEPQQQPSDVFQLLDCTK